MQLFTTLAAPIAGTSISPFQIFGAGLGLMGTIAEANALKAQAQAEQQAAEFQARQMEIKAKEEQAAAQREALERKRERNIAMSRLQTVAAASGFSATDPTALDLTGDIARYGTFREQMELYGGAARRRGLEYAAAGERAGGRARAASYRAQVGPTILGGFSTMFRGLA